MCHFFATEIFDHPRLKDVTYYMRLDTDSYIFKPLCYDPIALLHDHNKTYGWRSRSMDPDWVTVGLWNLIDKYAQEHPQVEENLKKNEWWWPDGRLTPDMNGNDFPTYYNNFEIIRLESFRRPDIKEWFEEILTDPKRFYKYRWGELFSLRLQRV